VDSQQHAARVRVHVSVHLEQVQLRAERAARRWLPASDVATARLQHDTLLAAALRAHVSRQDARPRGRLERGVPFPVAALPAQHGPRNREREYDNGGSGGIQSDKLQHPRAAR
ncbi:unnamed protein product, partial [Closterium sp. Naga37s-1]